MKPEELSHQGNDPGAVKHGNFMNYYTFHSVQERLINLQCKMFPPNLNKQVLCLDIGCNTGELTKELLKYIKSIYPNCDIHILAVDIDPTLIERAVENAEPNITFLRADIMIENDKDIIRNYLNKFDRISFDITFCFSVTMWIHINNGDEGLIEFLKFIKNYSNTVIIECQPWNCYRNAQRRIKKAGSNFPLYDKLKIRSDVTVQIENTITSYNFKKLHESSSTSWNRRIQSFTKN